MLCADRAGQKIFDAGWVCCNISALRLDETASLAGSKGSGPGSSPAWPTRVPPAAARRACSMLSDAPAARRASLNVPDAWQQLIRGLALVTAAAFAVMRLPNLVSRRLLGSSTSRRPDPAVETTAQGADRETAQIADQPTANAATSDRTQSQR